jgi:hypothetical protein
VADEHQYGPGIIVPTLPQEGKRQLQAVGSGSLDGRIEAVGRRSGCIGIAS